MNSSQPSSFRLRIRETNGKGFELQALHSETVGELKKRVEELIGTPTEDQRLICNGTLMDENRSVASYSLADGAVILSAPRLRMRHGSGINGGTGWGHCRPEGLVQPWDSNRGMLMVPGCGDPWRPATVGKMSPEVSDIFFDSERVHDLFYIQPCSTADTCNGAEK
jgi:hypothetical protein